MAHGRPEEKMLRTVVWKEGSVSLLDQTRLPNKLVYIRCKKYKDIVNAIKNMVVRGAPAIGVSAAFGLALAASTSKAKNAKDLMKDLDKAYWELRSTRPTAINLFWGLDRVMNKAKTGTNTYEIKGIVIDEAKRIAQEDIQNNMTLGLNGAKLLYDGDVVITHCNAGALATSAYGTALGVIRAAKEAGKSIRVIATETRPVMQGSRLTTFELRHDNIDVTLIPDTAVGHIMSKGGIKCVIVGADRILRTGHVFNKIGTYQIALMARIHQVPFYVAAPVSSFDFKSNLQDVPIEERRADEVLKIGKKRVAARGVAAYNPAFDVTPPELISGIVTEKGILTPPFESHIELLAGKLTLQS
ncbi:MAG TPA: S-methyl-5-thioribose-1-phosphate isomerase [Nitrososphaeraceae archaeon]